MLSYQPITHINFFLKTVSEFSHATEFTRERKRYKRFFKNLTNYDEDSQVHQYEHNIQFDKLLQKQQLHKKDILKRQSTLQKLEIDFIITHIIFVWSK